MPREYEVGTIFVQNRENPTSDSIYARINPSTVTVGNSDDISANPSCGGTIEASAIFACGLKGTVIGIRQDNAEVQNLMEVRAYPWKNIASSATTQNDAGCY